MEVALAYETLNFSKLKALHDQVLHTPQQEESHNELVGSFPAAAA